MAEPHQHAAEEHDSTDAITLRKPNHFQDQADQAHDRERDEADIRQKLNPVKQERHAAERKWHKKRHPKSGRAREVADRISDPGRSLDLRVSAEVFVQRFGRRVLGSSKKVLQKRSAASLYAETAVRVAKDGQKLGYRTGFWDHPA